MSKLKNLYACFASVLILMASCKKEGELFIIQKDAALKTVTASSSNLVLKESAQNDTAMTFSWAAANFGEKTAVSYTLQLTVPADTMGATAWSKVKNFTAGNNVLKYGFTGKSLNNLLLSMDLPSEVVNNVVVRIKADVVRVNVDASKPSPIPSVYSAPMTVKITPFSGDPVYTSFLWVPGNYQGWNPGAAPKIVSIKADKVFEGYVDLQAGEFKFTAQPDWTPMAYGDGGAEKLIEANYAGGNFNAPSSGYYFLYANLNTMKYKFIKTNWGVIGDATPSGWDNDTDLVYSASTKKWTVTLNLKNTGSFKFRANDGWDVAMGLKAGKLAYSDNPVYPYDANVGNISVAEAGNYTITLDFSTPGNYIYKLVKN
jgi:hypothetical protein